jgi:DNA-binding PadR family transcriptional regulator
VLYCKLNYSVEEMAGQSHLLGPHEQVVLLAIVHAGEEAYGMTIRREVEERSGRTLSIGAVYTTLDRLQRKGYVRSRMGEATPERGGRAKRHYRITAKGQRALKESHQLLRSMTEGLAFDWSLK